MNKIFFGYKFWLVLAIICILPAMASALTLKEVEQAKSGKVLGESITYSQNSYPPVPITSFGYKDVVISVTPINFDGTQWQYKINWARRRNSQGSLVVYKKSKPGELVFVGDPANQTDSSIFYVSPSTAYTIKFYSKPGKSGPILVSKNFTSLPTPTPKPQESCNFVVAPICPDGSLARVENCKVICPATTGSSTKVSTITITTNNSLSLTQNNFATITFNAVSNVLFSNFGYVPASTFKFTASGTVPGMVFGVTPIYNYKNDCLGCNYTSPPFRDNVYYLSGAPTTVGNFPITITATDQNGNSANQNFIVWVSNSGSATSTATIITSVSPAYGPVGTKVTLYGKFTFGDNTIIMNGLAMPSIMIENLSSPDGLSLSFVVPELWCTTNYYVEVKTTGCNIKAEAGNYYVSVKNSKGTSNNIIFTITGEAKTCPLDDITNCPSYESFTDNNGCVRKICKYVELPQIRVGKVINKNGTLYYVAESGLYGFSDMYIFNSWYTSMADVVAANNTEAGLPVLGIVPLRINGCNNILAQINNSCPTPTPTPTLTPTPTPTPTSSGVISCATQYDCPNPNTYYCVPGQNGAFGKCVAK